MPINNTFVETIYPNTQNPVFIAICAARKDSVMVPVDAVQKPNPSKKKKGRGKLLGEHQMEKDIQKISIKNNLKEFSDWRFGAL